MAIVNPNAGKTAGLLDQVLAEREALATAQNPSNQPGGPIRSLIQNPQLQSESPGSARVASVKPNLGVEAQAVVPAQPGEIPGMGQPGIQAPAIGGGIVGPNNFQEQPAPTGPAAQGGSQYQNPNPAPAGPVAAPGAPAAPGRPASAPPAVRSFTPVSSARISNRYIVDLPTKLRPRSDSGFA